MSKFKDLTDEALGQTYLDDNSEIKKLGVELDEIKGLITERIDAKGEDIGNHKGIQAGSVTMIKEGRVSISVDNDSAVKLLEKNDLPEFVEKMAEIKIRQDVNIDKIPPKVIKEMEKYFDIVIHKTADKDVVKMLLEKNKISQDEFDKIVSKKTTYAIKVKAV